jgi:hypothetical protein
MHQVKIQFTEITSHQIPSNQNPISFPQLTITSQVQGTARPVDVGGFLTELSTSQGMGSGAELVSDTNKARALLQSVVSSNPKHSGGWIAASRVEVLAGRKQDAKELLAMGLKHCKEKIA